MSGYFNPVLSKMEDDIAHPAFNNLFLKYSLSKKKDLIVTRNARGNNGAVFLGANLFLENSDNYDIEYEIDESKVLKWLSGNLQFSNTLGLVTSPCVAIKKSIKVKAHDEKTLDFVITVSNEEEEIVKTLDYYRIQENIKQEFNIARAKAEEEARYLNLRRSNLEAFNMILPYIMHSNPMRSMYMKEFADKEFKQSDFWKYGISGDLPIILITVKSASDIYIVKELLKVHEMLRVKGIRTDLCILDYEKNVYERYVKEQIIQQILNLQIGYLQNISGGIFILNANEIEDEELFKFKANIVINASKGNAVEAIKEMEDEYKKNLSNVGYQSINNIEKNIVFDAIKPNIDMENLKFYNGFGGFSPDGKEYIIRQNKSWFPPAPWSNVLANEKFGTIVTNNLGGFTYSKNSRLNRISSWVNNPSFDVPSEIFYLRDLEYGNVWTLNSNVMPDDEDYYSIFGFGYVRYYHASLGIIQELETFVPNEDSVKVSSIRLKNTLSEKRKLKLLYYIKPVLGEDETKTSGYINLNFDKENNTLFAKNVYGDSLSSLVYVSSSEIIKSFTGNELSFFGMGDFRSPDSIFKTGLDFENGLGVPSCIALEMEIELEPYEEKRINFVLGEEENKENAITVLNKYITDENLAKGIREVCDYWNSILRKVQVRTNNEDIDFMLNRMDTLSDYYL
ncbi:MAG: hypothetical protein HFJ50_03920 [Clostridia bacterium]|nr:hypothetical protein [Clostridia bacterium]